ncbi:hypothetical protein H072_11489 [Dactylellina haptotyla CBS 200.50]|uniref:Uncharacterized protein n=1 Tax=Dactylellina haptotyla (strain CBS 200.50) TaxID=1284197 RepID=S7ZXK1_DACHA|nr:hypothetical protein H072_11489 [Dactylellina haptotyla CBS 200.50]
MATLQLHRRISLSDLEALEAPVISSQPAPPPLPEYSEYKPGSREEFYKDLEAYQAAAQIHAQHKAAPASPTAHDLAPSYDSIGDIALPTIRETHVFKKRLLKTLRAIHEFAELRRRTPKWSNCFALPFKVRIVLAAGLFLGMICGLLVMGIIYRQAGGMLALGFFLVAHIGINFFLIRTHIVKTRLIQALEVALEQVERFERIDDVSFARMKKGINVTLSPLFWIQSERRMREAIPDSARVVLPPPVHVDIPPPPLEDLETASHAGTEQRQPQQQEGEGEAGPSRTAAAGSS